MSTKFLLKRILPGVHMFCQNQHYEFEMNLLQQALPCSDPHPHQPCTWLETPTYYLLAFLPLGNFAKSQVQFFVKDQYFSWTTCSHCILFPLYEAFDNVRSSSMLMTMHMKLVAMFWGALFKWVKGSLNGNPNKSILLSIIVFLVNDGSTFVILPSSCWLFSTP